MPLTIDRLKAENAAKEYTRRNAKKYIIALLGDGSGTVEVTGRDNWVYIRVEADNAQTTQAKEKNSVAHVDNLPVIVERVLSQGATSYQVVGIAPVPDYPNSDFDGSVGAHSTQHERKNFNLGGFDPLNIWTRMQVELRAREQATPNMTVYVEAGEYPMNGVGTEFLGGNSPAVTAPAAGYSRCDLLYLNSANALAFANGTPTIVFVLTDAPRPTAPTGNYFPVAYIYTQSGQTTIVEANIKDARMNFASAGRTGASYSTVTVQTAAYTITATDEIIICNSATAYTQALPAASGSGRILTIANINTGVITLDGNGGDTINGLTTQILNQWDTVQVADYAANKWVVI